MGHIFGVNAAVCFVLGCALLLVWMQDKEQRFTFDMGWLQILSSVLSLAYILYHDGTGTWKTVGMYTMGLGATGLFVLASMAINHLLSNEKPNLRLLVSVALVVVVFYAVGVLMLESAYLWIAANASLYSAFGIYSLARLWNHGLPERVIGLSFMALGLNALNPIFLGEADGAPLQVASGTVIRVILCSALDLTNSREVRVKRISSMACRKLGLEWNKDIQPVFGRIEARSRHANLFFSIR